MKNTSIPGADLFLLYVDEGGEYASVLQLAYHEIGDKLFGMLEECEKTGKKIVVTDDMEDAIDSPVTVTLL